MSEGVDFLLIYLFMIFVFWGGLIWLCLWALRGAYRYITKPKVRK